MEIKRVENCLSNIGLAFAMESLSNEKKKERVIERSRRRKRVGKSRAK